MGREKVNKRCLELDCASTMFVLGRTEKRKSMIRLSITLYEQIEKNILQTALERTIGKYPYFFVRFVAEGNRLFAEPSGQIPKVREKQEISCFQTGRNDKVWESQVMYSDKSILLEYFHAVSDGMGGMQFLLHLTAEYLLLKYNDGTIIRIPPVIPIQEQAENGYHKYGRSLSLKRSGKTAYKIKGTLKPAGETTINTYRLYRDEIKNLSKKYGVSVNEFMSAILSIAIWNIQKMGEGKNKKIRISIPVNLRTRFPCRTMRNFTMNVYPEADPFTESMELSAICMKFHRYMEQSLSTSLLAGRCADAETLSGSVLLSLLPLSVKRWLVQTGLDCPITGSSMTFSNMGNIVLPEGMKLYVDNLGMIFSTKPECPYSCSLISLGNKMNLTFLRTLEEPLLEMQFEKLLQDKKISYQKIEQEKW